MNLLAWDTATEVCTVALQIDGQLYHRHEHQPQKQANLILPMIDELMAEAAVSIRSLDAIAFGQGPGSFTGLRIAAGVAQGLAFAEKIPVIPVSSLAIIAQTAYRKYQQGSILSTIDARMSEVYWAEYCVNNAGLVEPVSEPAVGPVEGIALNAELVTGVGSGFRAFPEAFETHLGHKLQQFDADLWPEATDLLMLAADAYQQGRLCTVDQAVPLYVRNQVAKKKSA